jgi:hypothetical protein
MGKQLFTCRRRRAGARPRPPGSFIQEASHLQQHPHVPRPSSSSAPAASSSPLRTSRTAPGSTNVVGSQDHECTNRTRSPAGFRAPVTVCDGAWGRHCGPADAGSSDDAGTADGVGPSWTTCPPWRDAQASTARASAGSGTVPTVVTRPEPCARVVTAGHRPKCGWP